MEWVFIAYLTVCPMEASRCAEMAVPGAFSSQELAFMAAQAQTKRDHSLFATITIGNRPRLDDEHVIASPYDPRFPS